MDAEHLVGLFMEVGAMVEDAADSEKEVSGNLGIHTHSVDILLQCP